MGPLDAFWDAAEADEAAWPRFVAAFAGTPLHLVLEGEAEAGAPLRPRIFPLETGPVALAFDSDDRFAGAIHEPTASVILTGAEIAARLSADGAGIGLALNPGAGGAETVLEPATLAWIAEAAVSEAAERVAGIAPPEAPDPALLEALGSRIEIHAERLAGAWLTASDDGLLLVLEAAPGADAGPAAADLARIGQAATESPFAATIAGGTLADAARRQGIGLLAGG